MFPPVAAHTAIVLIFACLPEVLLSGVGGLFSSRHLGWCLFPLLLVLGHLLGSLTEEAVSFHFLEIVAVRFVRVLAVLEDSPPSATFLFSLFFFLVLFRCSSATLLFVCACMESWNLVCKVCYGYNHETPACWERTDEAAGPWVRHF